MNRSVGLAYAAVTFTLLVAVFASVTCLSSAASLQQETTCQTMMSLSSILLVSSQIVFFVIALQKKGNDQSVPSTSSASTNRVDSSRLRVLVFAGIMLLAIVALVLLLSYMPS